MYPQNAVLSLLALSSSASAFFPTSEIADEIRHTAGNVGSYFKHHGPSSRHVHKRGEQKQQNPGIFISIAPFARSSARYKIRSAPPPPTRSVPFDKRSNEYKIVPANQPSQPTSLAVDQDGTDYSYFSTMGIGSKNTPMYMLLDTGSAVTWVMADNCKSGPCSIHNTFGSTTGSSTLKTGGPTFKLDYGSGDVSGTMANDTISFAGLKVTAPIGLADTVSDDFQNYPFDGILGLGRIPIQDAPSVTFVQEIAQNKLLPANIFGVNLQRNSDGSNDGEITFGAADTSKFKGDLHWINTIDDHSFWEIVADDVFVDGKSAGLNQKRTAILDTGTSYMLLPPSDAKAIFDKIPGSSTSDNVYWSVPCNANTPVQVAIGGVGFNISPKDYVGDKTSKRDDMCVSHIVGLAAAGDDHTWLLGDTFLKNVYTVFDADKNRVGFGAKSGSSVIDQGEAQKSADGTSTGTSSSSSASSSQGSSSNGGATSSSSGSSARPSVTGGLGLPGTGSSSTKDGSASGTAGSTGSSSPTDGTKTSAASTSTVQRVLLSVVAISLSVFFM